MIAEDSAHMRALLRSMLRALGFGKVSAESNGEDALIVIATGWPDVILLDWNMPEMDGLELARKIRALEEPICRTPIVMVTAHSSSKRLADANAVGVNSFLCKPLSVVGLDAHLRKVIQSSYEQPRHSADRSRRDARTPVVDLPEPNTAPAPDAPDEIEDAPSENTREATYL